MIVIFGGSFNPPTIAHYQIAKHILTQLNSQHFFFLPVGDYYPKKGLISSVHRVAMLKLMCQELKRASVSTIEVEANHVLTTFETLTQLQMKFPQETLAFVIGADNLEDLPNWVEYDKLIQNFKLIVFRRADINVDAIIKTQFKTSVRIFFSLNNSNIINANGIINNI